MDEPTPETLAKWRARATAKDAIVPFFWEVFPSRVTIECGKCRRTFARNLVPNVNDPTFVCPNEDCQQKNWVPITYKSS